MRDDIYGLNRDTFPLNISYFFADLLLLFN